MDTYFRLIHAPYDNEGCVQAYTELLEHPKDPVYVEQALLKSLPVIGCVLKAHFRWLEPKSEAYEESTSCCAMKLYTMLLTDKFYEKYYFAPKTQFAFLYQVCKFEVIAVLNRLNKDKQLGISLPPAILNLDTSETGIYYRVFLKELPAEIYARVHKLIRFSGDAHGVCDLLAHSLIGGRGVPVSLIRRQWGTANLKFFVEYIRVLIRHTLIGLKEELSLIPSVMEAEEAGILEATAQEIYESGLQSSDDSNFWFGVDRTEDVS